MSRRSSSSRKVVWDEENLKENEEIQKEYSAVRIQEPKTPYRPPLASDSLEDEMRPLQLDEGGRQCTPTPMLLLQLHICTAVLHALAPADVPAVHWRTFMLDSSASQISLCCGCVLMLCALHHVQLPMLWAQIA